MMVSFISREVVKIVISILQIQTPAIYQTENNGMKVIKLVWQSLVTGAQPYKK